MTQQDEVASATQLAEALKLARPQVTANEIAQALHSPGVYPNLTANQMGLVLRAPNVFPAITAAETRSALSAVGYTATDIDSAITQLFPPVAQIRRIGPAGVQATTFDDTSAAQSLQQPLTSIRVQSGNIVDAIQVCYGSTRTALPHHGGIGGAVTEVVLDQGDGIAQFSCFYGSWYGGNYILQLTIHTKKGKTYGPFGTMEYATTQTPFSLVVNSNEQAIAVFGSVAYGNNGQSQFLGSLGITVSS